MIPLVAAGVVIVVIAVVVYASMKERNPIALTLDFQKYPLIDKKIISHDTRRFTFALPSPNHKLGLPIGQHMTLMFKDKDGKGVQRSYTPVTGDETLGTVSFVIKVYKAGVHPKFPEGGKLSQYLDSLKIGDKLDMKGPKGHLSWLGRGNFTVKVMRKPLSTRKATHIGMIAGGTGITPMLQVLDAIFRDPNDKTCIKMLYANQCKYRYCTVHVHVHVHVLHEHTCTHYMHMNMYDGTQWTRMKCYSDCLIKSSSMCTHQLPTLTHTYRNMNMI